jgi:RHS repeat-associated protein
MRPSDWSPLGLAHDPTPGDPVVVREGGRKYAAVADAIARAAVSLRGLEAGASNVDSVKALLESRDTIVDTVGKAEGRYRSAGTALGTYATVLDRVQSETASALHAAKAAAGDGADAGSQQAKYHQMAKDAEDAGDAEEQDKYAKKEKAAQEQASRAAGAVSAQKAVVHQAVADRDKAARTAISSIQDTTSNDGLNDSWWDDWGAKITEWIANIAEQIATIAGILALIFCWVPILGEVLMVIAAVAGIVAALANIILAATGEKSWGEAAMSVVFAALGCIGVGGAMRALGGLAKMGLKAGAKAAFKDMAGSLKNLASKVKGSEPSTRCNAIGEPVDAANGFVYFARRDAELPGDLPLVLMRRYVSGFTKGRLFGSRWASTLDQRLEVGEDQLSLVRGDASVLAFPLLAEGDEGLPWGSADRWTLSRTGADEYQAIDPVSGLRYRFAGAESDKWLVEQSDRAGGWIRYERDAAGLPSRVVHHGGYEVMVTSHDGRVTGLALAGDAGSSVSLTTFDYVQTNLVSETSATGATVRYELDEAGRVAAWTDTNNTRYVYAYDQADRCVSEGLPDPTDATYRYAYAYLEGPLTGGLTTLITNAGGGQKRFEVDQRGLVLAEIDELGNRTEYDYDSSSRRTAVRDPLGNKTLFSWDDASRMVSITDPEGASSQVTYDTDGLPVAVVDATGAVTSQRFDEAGRLVERTDPAGGVESWQWLAGGSQVVVTDASNRWVELSRDGAGLVTAARDAAGATVIERDQLGNPVRVVDPAGGTRVMSWSAEGRLLSRVNPDGTEESWTWDGQGNLTEQVDAAGRATTFRIAPFDVVGAIENPDGSVLGLAYDDECRLISVTNQNQATWRYLRDVAGRVIGEVDYDGREARYELDAAGRTTAMVNAAGERVEILFDRAGRMVRRHADGQTAEFSYDAAGRLLGASGAGVVLARQLDSSGRLVAESIDGARMAWQLDAAGRRVGRATPGGVVSGWSLDEAGRHNGLQFAGQQVGFGLDLMGRATSVEFAGGRIDSVFDVMGRLASRATSGVVGEKASWQVAYSYAAAGELAQVQDSGTGTRQLELDAAGRISAVTGGAGEAYAYDQAGNITRASWNTTDTDTQGERIYSGTLLAQAGRDSYAYDAAGRLVSRVRRLLSGGTKTWNYTWNSLNQLTQVSTPDGHSWAYGYDPLNRRISKTHLDGAGVVVESWRFAWDGPVLAEQTHTTVAGSRTTTWEHDGFTPIAQSQTSRGVGGSAGWSQAQVDAEFAAIVTDVVGAPLRLLSADGEVVWTSSASVWGATDADTAMPLRFPGQYHDVETGLFYNLNRYYNPDTGRYVTADPLGLAPSPNPHSYVGNPTTQIDPLGLHGVDASGPGSSRWTSQNGVDVGTLMGDSDNVVVLGRLEDTAVARGWPGHTVLDTPNWTLEVNDLFIARTISEGRTAYLASPLEGNLLQTAGRFEGQATIYARELQQLIESGYTRMGDHMVPPR